jgi:hypothetical protein
LRKPMYTRSPGAKAKLITVPSRLPRSCQSSERKLH